METLPLKHRRLGAIIPAYQAANSIVEVLQGLLEYFTAEQILLVDDGSTDDTAILAKALDVGVLSQSHNQGKGAALARGLNRGRELGWDWAITLDADGQHAKSDLQHFMDAIPNENTAILVGQRMRSGSNMPWHRRFSNTITTSFISHLAGIPVFDAQGGFRAYRLDVSNAFPATGRFEWESQVLVQCGRMGYGIEAIPVQTVYAGQGSHMRLGRDTWRFLHMVGKLTWTS